MSPPQPQRVTVHDVAAAASVSCGTVSQVLDSGYVSAEARAAIEAAIVGVDNVGMVGFDDSSWALRTSPPLSTVHQPAREIGLNAAELVLRQVNGTDPAPRSILLDTPVVRRGSA